MTVAEEKNEELDANATAGGSTFIAATLSLAMLLAQYSFSPVALSSSNITISGTSGTVSQAVSLQISELDLFKQINRIYDDLLKNQQELDADAKRALYGNMWDLYT
jgi:hypothetical protein